MKKNNYFYLIVIGFTLFLAFTFYYTLNKQTNSDNSVNSVKIINQGNVLLVAPSALLLEYKNVKYLCKAEIKNSNPVCKVYKPEEND